MGTQYVPQIPALRQGQNMGPETHGLDSEIFDREWDTFLVRQKEYFDNLVGRIGLAQGIAAATGIAPEEALPAANVQMDTVWQDQLKDRFANMGQSDLNDLIGQARAHGIDDPEKIPPEVLFQMLEERRAAVRGRDTEDLPSSLGEWGELVRRRLRGEDTGYAGDRAISEQVEAGALGTFRGILDVAQTIPFLGDILAKRRTIQKADQTINMALEGLRADLPEERMQAFNLAAGTGGFVAYTYLGSLGYRAALGIVPAAAVVNGKRIDTLGRAALRGGLTAWALEGGGEDPILPSEDVLRDIVGGDWKRALEVLETRGGKIGAGAALGAFFDYALPNLVRRVHRSFRSRMTEEMGRYDGDPGPIVDADYTIVGEEPQLTPGQRRIGGPPDEGTPVGVYDEAGVAVDVAAPDSRLYPSPLPAVGLPAPGLPPAGPAGPMGLVQQLDNLGVPMGPAGFLEPPAVVTPEIAPPTPAVVTPPPGSQRLLGTALHNENAALRQQLNQMVEQRNLAQRMAELDGLTGVGNRRAMERALPAAEADEAMSVVAFDADGFKAVNDVFGHQAGDEALVRFTQVMQQASDEMGLPNRVFRPGGDEFVAIVPREYAGLWRDRVEELSLQRFERDNPDVMDVVETTLTGAVGPNYAEADALLTHLKGGRRTQTRGFAPDEAVAEAQALTRQNQMLESPLMDDMLEQRAFDETDLVQAVVASNPSGVNVLRNVGDAGSVIRRLAEADQSLPIGGVVRHPVNDTYTANVERRGAGYELRTYDAGLETSRAEFQSPNEVLATLRRFGFNAPTRRIMPQFMRVVERQVYGNQVQDLLISAGRPITNQMVREYGATGVFTGARVVTYDGLTGTVSELRFHGHPDMTEVMLEVPNTTWRENYSPSQVMLIPEDFAQAYEFDLIFDDFKNYVIDEFEASPFGEAGNFNPEMDFYSLPVIRQMPRLLDEFLTRSGITDEVTRSAIRAGVNNTVNRALQAQAPAEDQAVLRLAQDQNLQAHQDNAAARRRQMREETITLRDASTGRIYEAPRPALPQVQTLANTKGFEYIPTSPPPLRYGAQITVGTSSTNYQADVSVRLYDTRTGDYAGQLTGYLEHFGRFYVSYVDAFASGSNPQNRLGPRMVRDAARQLVQRLRSEGYDIKSLYGHRISGARAAPFTNVNRVHARNYGSGADPFMEIDADQVMQGVRTGGTLKHKFSDLEVPVESDAAALEFLREFQGDLPDIAPITDYPIDALPIGPGMDNPGHSLPPVWEEGFEQYMDGYIDMTEETERYVDDVLRGDSPAEEPDMYTGRFGGGAIPPGGPPRPPVRRAGFPASGGGYPGGGLPSTEVGSETLGQQFRTLARNNPAAVGDLLRRQEGAWLRLLEPMRHRFLALEQQLTDLGIDQGRIWRQYAEMTTAVDKSHNEANPWHQEWTGITSRFRRKYRRDGTVVRIEEIPNWNDKLRAMEEAGYSPAEMEAQSMIRPFFDRLHGEAGLTHYIFDYIPHLRQRQGMNGVENPFEGTEAGLPRELQFFAEHVRAGNVDMRQLDIGTLGALWIRGWQFKKHVGPIWDEMYRTWDDPLVPERLRELVKDWMHVVRVGHDPKEEIAVAGARQVLNTLGVPVTSGEIAGLWNGLLTNTYRSMLGGRPDVIFRDSIQPLLTWARVGGNINDLAEVYTDFIRKPEARGQMIERAERMGTVVRGMTQTAYAEAFTQRVQTTEGYPVFNEVMEQRRERVATVGDFLHDLVPSRFRGGIQGTYADPLLMYTKLGELNRIVSGEYGYRLAMRGLERYYTGKTDYDTLLGESRARVYPEPIRRRFQELVQAGNAEGAAALLANEAANLQFRYGSREGPIGTRNVPGRLSMMFGTFSQQFLAYTKEALSNGTVGDRAGFGARYAAILAAIGGAGLATGWKFSKWMWHNSLAFAGGPIVEFGATAAHALGGFSAKAQGQDPRPHQVRAMEEMTPEGVAGGFLESVFPYAGAVRTSQRFGNTVGPGSAHQGERALELLFTGNQQWENIYNRDYRNPVQPTTPDFARPMYWTPEQGTGGFPQQPAGAPTPPSVGVPPVAPWDTISTDAVGAMQEALRSTPPGQWRERMAGTGYNEAVIQQVIRAGAGAQQ